jgi:hypothetical protein
MCYSVLSSDLVVDERGGTVGTSDEHLLMMHHAGWSAGVVIE